MSPLEIFAWGAIPLVGVCLVVGIHRRIKAAREERQQSFRSLRATAESYRRQQSELMQRAIHEARNASR
jgi:hypothetical protein